MIRTIFNLLLLLCMLGLPTTPAIGEDPIPSIEQSVEAWYTVREWVTDLAVPDDSPAVPIRHASGCSIILRQDGRVVGSGTASSSDDRMLHRAAARALRAALADPAMAAIPAELRDSLGGRLTVELELAGPMQPLIGDEPGEFGEDIHPLRHGLALRLQDEWSVKYPSRLRSMNRWADATMFDGMAFSLGLSSGLQNTLSRNDVAAYRFQTIDLAQTSPDAPPQVVDGGTMRHPPSMPGRPDLERALESLVGHIEGRLWPGEEPLGLMGSYEPVRDRYDPIVAPVRDQALTAWALGRTAASDAVDRATRDRASDAAATLLLALIERDEEEIATLPEDASVLLAMEANRTLDPDRLEPLIASQRDALRNRIETAIELDTLPNEQDLAFIVFVLGSNGATEDCALARRLADLVWNRTDAERQVSLLPWIAWTELAMSGCGAEPNIEALRALRTMVLDRQVPPGDDRFGAELVGGIVLGRSAVDVNAQSLRPFASMPALLRHPDATPAEEREEQNARLMTALRFLLQLQTGPEDASLHRSSDRAVGGIRMAAWDSRMPTIAQALALLTLLETLELLPDDSRGIPGDRGLY